MSALNAAVRTNDTDLRDPMTGRILPLAATWPLGRDDRCDALGSVADARGQLRAGTCGAEALVRAWIPGVSRPLLFCGHHFRVHEPALAQIGAYVHDERNRLTPVRDLPAPGPESRPAGVGWRLQEQ
ncbi:DUF7455 domain-containing protein [Segeticoccus sp.]|uniref:DUF7455 domain-containing protein n=1 Tax=Segeticoccus sp. TaxID=2706531 RepID=UPI003BEF3BF2